MLLYVITSHYDSPTSLNYVVVISLGGSYTRGEQRVRGGRDRRNTLPGSQFNAMRQGYSKFKRMNLSYLSTVRQHGMSKNNNNSWEE